MRYHERMVMLSVIDGLWKEHLLAMDHLKEGIGLRGYAQQDPLVAYKKESFDMFEAMMMQFQEDTVRFLFRMQIVGPDGQPDEGRAQLRACAARASGGRCRRHVAAESARKTNASTAGHSAASPIGQPRGDPRSHPAPPSTTIDQLEKEFQRKKQRELEGSQLAGGDNGSSAAQRRTGDKVGRNDPCPCGSGKKYKKCHGAE